MYGVKKNSGSVVCKDFNDQYLKLTKHLIKNGSHEKSRNGDTVELLNFKTLIHDPLRRNVGGFGRNANVFFLLYEAMWIWAGKKDVESLSWFNANMKNFSDDGKTFHAPYGFRLRSWGIPSNYETYKNLCKEQGRVENLSKDAQGTDQIRLCLKMLEENSQDRRVVASIWNPDLDLGLKCKDLPCNDMVMFKVRDEKLHLTVQNRSNDIHWGLPTNVFQFSFILEMMSAALGVGIGTQTHNSQSLHCYLSNQTTLTMLNKSENKGQPLYFTAKANKIKFDGIKKEMSVTERLEVIDYTIGDMMSFLRDVQKDKKFDYEEHDEHFEMLGKLSPELGVITQLLTVYLEYKKEGDISDDAKYKAINRIVYIGDENLDIKMLALNFFIVRLKVKNPERIVKLTPQAAKSLMEYDY